MLQMINNIFKNEKGSGLVLSLMVLLVLSVLGSALGVVTVGSHRLSDINRDSTSAYYIAEAGANMAYEEIKSEVKSLGTDPSKKGNDFINEVNLLVENMEFPYHGEGYFVEQSGESPSATINVINEKELITDEKRFSKEYIIQSIGSIAGKKRTVEKTFTVTWEEKEPKNEIIPSLAEKSNITFFNNLQLPNENQSNIDGLILYGNGSTVLGKGNNDYDHLNFSDNLNISNDDFHTAFDVFFPNIPANGYSSTDKIEKNGDFYSVSENVYLEKLEIKNNTVINTDGKNVNILVNNLDFNNKSTLKISAPGTVNLFIINKINISNNGNSPDNLNSYENAGNLNIIYKGEDFVLPNGLKMNATVINRDARMEIGNNSEITGSIISGGSNLIFGNINSFTHKNHLDGSFSDGNSTEELEPNNDFITSTPAIEQ